jgi:hypothetical protein
VGEPIGGSAAQGDSLSRARGWPIPAPSLALVREALPRWLLQRGLVEPADLERAQKRQRIYRGTLDTALLELRLCDEATVRRALEASSGLPAADPAWLLETGRGAARFIDVARARRLHAQPVAEHRGRLEIVVAHDADLDEVADWAELEHEAGCRFHLAAEVYFEALVARVHDRSLPPRYLKLLAQMGAEGGSARGLGLGRWEGRVGPMGRRPRQVPAPPVETGPVLLVTPPPQLLEGLDLREDELAELGEALGRVVADAVADAVEAVADAPAVAEAAEAAAVDPGGAQSLGMDVTEVLPPSALPHPSKLLPTGEYVHVEMPLDHEEQPELPPQLERTPPLEAPPARSTLIGSWAHGPEHDEITVVGPPEEKTPRLIEVWPPHEQLSPALASLRAQALEGGEDAASAIAALADQRDTNFIPELIPLLESKDAGLAEAALAALRSLSAQDFGPSRWRWIFWWRLWGKKHRVEWLLEALSAQEPERRLHAAQELERISGLYVGYHFDLGRQEREAARKRWQKWWQEVGRHQVGR